MYKRINNRIYYSHGKVHNTIVMNPFKKITTFLEMSNWFWITLCHNLQLFCCSFYTYIYIFIYIYIYIYIYINIYIYIYIHIYIIFNALLYVILIEKRKLVTQLSPLKQCGSNNLMPFLYVARNDFSLL